MSAQCLPMARRSQRPVVPPFFQEVERDNHGLTLDTPLVQERSYLAHRSFTKREQTRPNVFLKLEKPERSHQRTREQTRPNVFLKLEKPKKESPTYTLDPRGPAGP